MQQLEKRPPPSGLKLPAATDYSRITSSLYRINIDAGHEHEPDQAPNEALKQVLAGIINLWHSRFGKPVDDLQKVKIGPLNRETGSLTSANSLCMLGLLHKSDSGYKPTLNGLSFSFKDAVTYASLSPAAKLIRVDMSRMQVDHNGTHSILSCLSTMSKMPAQECINQLKDLLGWNPHEILVALKELQSKRLIEISGSKSEMYLCINQNGKNHLANLNSTYKNHSALKADRDLLVRNEVLSAVAFMCKNFNLKEGVRFYEIRDLLLANSGPEVTEFNIESLVRSGFLEQRRYTLNEVPRLTKSTNLYRLAAGQSPEILREYKFSEEFSSALKNVEADEIAATINGKRISFKIELLEKGLREHAKDKSDITTVDVKNVIEKLGISFEKNNPSILRIKEELFNFGILVLDDKRSSGQRKFRLRDE